MDRTAFLAALTAAAAAPCAASAADRLRLDDAAWRARLTPAAYAVLRQAGTEPPFSSPLDRETARGVYACAGCRRALFSSAVKYDSGTGWPSFWAALPDAVATREDRTLGMVRTEVRCARCDGHLGHVFPDGPPPTGRRYCMNGVALRFTPDAAAARRAPAT